MSSLAYYNAQISFTVETKNGGIKQEKTYFLVRGVSVTDVEKQIHEQLEIEDGYENFKVISVSQSNISHIIDYDEEASYFQSQIIFEHEKENGGIKETKEYYLVRAQMNDCKQVIENDLKSEPLDYRIASISESNITMVIDKINNLS